MNGLKLRFCLLTARLLAGACLFCQLTPAWSQEPAFKNDVNGFATAWVFADHSKYLGGGIEYARQQFRYVGADVGLAVLPSKQALGTVSDYFGNSLAQTYGGLRLAIIPADKVAVYGLVRGGVGATRGIQGYDAQGNYHDSLRMFPIFGAGAHAAVRVGEHWALTYTFLNQSVFFQPYTIYQRGSPILTTAFSRQTQEYRSGVSFRF